MFNGQGQRSGRSIEPAQIAANFAHDGTKFRHGRDEGALPEAVALAIVRLADHSGDIPSRRQNQPESNSLVANTDLEQPAAT
jgi:hypothetical protein